MSGFDAAKIDAAFWAGTTVKHQLHLQSRPWRSGEAACAQPAPDVRRSLPDRLSAPSRPLASGRPAFRSRAGLGGRRSSRPGPGARRPASRSSANSSSSCWRPCLATAIRRASSLRCGAICRELGDVVAAKAQRQVPRLVRLPAELLERAARAHQRRVERLALDQGHAELVELVVVLDVAGAGDDGRVREVLADHARALDALLDVVDRDDDAPAPCPRRRCASGRAGSRRRSSTRQPKRAHRLDLLGVVVEHGRRARRWRTASGRRSGRSGRSRR